MTKAVEVVAPTTVTPDTLRRVVQQFNKQIAQLQRQIDALKAAQ